MEGRPEGNGKEENSIRAPFPRQIPLNGGESFFPGWIRFSGMSVIQNLEDSGKGKVFFNRAGASFPVAVFAAGILPDNIRPFPLSLTKEASPVFS